ncbi:ABC transporter permease [Nocardioides immobilis]|uniref:ABC transporter permease n=1 Tax=Nocardioides immobilis TaxID=2049295 RepID=UPI0015F8D004|nr:ABC transporter permease [Nocardioides immobilis]
MSAEEATATVSGSGDASGASARGDRRGATVEVLRKYGLLLAFCVVVIVFSVQRPETFPTWDNATSILTTAAAPLILAVGLTVVLVMRDFDLSFGAVIGAGAAAAVVGMVSHGLLPIIAILATLLLGAVVGFANGFLVAYLGGSSFVITLAMGTIVTGIEYAISDQTTIYGGIPFSYMEIGQASTLGLSNLVWIAAVFSLAVALLLERTETGRYMYAIGGNAEAARLAGVRVKVLRLLGFVIVGVTASAVGVLISSQGASYSPNLGSAYLLPAFAAAFLGTAVFKPGEFTVAGTIVGVLFLGVIQTGLTMLNLPTWAINLIQGAILVVAVLFSQLERRSIRRTKTVRQEPTSTDPGTGTPFSGGTPAESNAGARPATERTRT